MDIFIVGPSTERTRPEIDWDSTNDQNGVDWDFVDEIINGQRPMSDYEPIRLVVASLRPGSWHCYLCPGTLPLISYEAVSLIGLRVFHQSFDLLPAKINDADFFLPVCRKPLDCFDRENSVYKTDRNADSIMRIDTYKFHEKKIDANSLFTIPEYAHVLYCTSAVRDAILKANLRGFKFKQITR